VFGGLHATEPLPSPEALLVLGRQFTPRVEARGPTPVLLDLAGLGRAWRTPHELGQALLAAARARSLAPNVALAHSRVAALIVARGRLGLTVVPAGDEARTLAPLPLALLDLPPEREELLRRWGLRTLGELAALPAAGLAERFGEDAARLRRLARGEDALPLVPTPFPHAFEMSLELDWPVDGLEPLSFLLARVLEPLCASLAARGRRAAAMTLELGLASGARVTRSLRPAAPSVEPRTWRTLLLLELETHPLEDAIQRLALSAEPTPARVVQFSLFDPAQPSPERLAETLARLQAWSAAGRGGAATLVDTHRPGAFAMTTFAPGPVSTRAGGVAAVPRVALRVFRPPLSAEVACHGGAPVFVAAPGVRGRVLGHAGPWRVSGDWWDVAYSREEWDVALETGLYRIFRDRLREAWFVEGELD
jgi:protein ImuB